MNSNEPHPEVPDSIQIYSQASIKCLTYHAVPRILEKSEVFKTDSMRKRSGWIPRICPHNRFRVIP